jgi:hypothetical protein
MDKQGDIVLHIIQTFKIIHLNLIDVDDGVRRNTVDNTGMGKT